MSGPVITVVIPTRNRLAMLKQAVLTVQCQTYPAVELVVVNEGSTDGTSEWLDMQRAAGVLKVVTHLEPKGLPAARNAGAAVSDGAWIAFLDDDDLWLPTKLEEQVRQLECTDREWSYVGAVHVNPELVPVATQRPISGRHSVVLRSGNRVPGGGSAVLVKADVFRELGGFREDLIAGEDWELWLRLSDRGEPSAIDLPLLVYRRWPSSMSHDLERMARARRQVADLHPDVLALYGDPGVERGYARVASEKLYNGGHRLQAARLAIAAGGSTGVLRAVFYLIVPASARVIGLKFRRGQREWVRPVRGWLSQQNSPQP